MGRSKCEEMARIDLLARLTSQQFVRGTRHWISFLLASFELGEQEPEPFGWLRPFFSTRFLETDRFGHMKLLRLLLFLAVSATAQENQARQFQISVEVRADDNTKPAVESYLKRELRSLRDVAVVDDGHFKLSVIVVPIERTAGRSGYALSVAQITQFNTNLLTQFTYKLPTNELTELNKRVSEFPIHEGHGVRVCGTDDLRKTCEAIIADIDTGWLEDYRRSSREINKMWNELLKKPKAEQNGKASK
jgi:hypothetical protein